MKKFIFFLAFFAFLFANSSFTSAQWLQSDSIFGGWVNIIKAKSNRLFLGTQSGLYISTDNGNKWIIKSNELNIRAITYNTTRVFASRDKGLLVSLDNGENWSPLNSVMDTTTVYSLANCGDTIFAGTANGVLVSKNNGVNWSRTTLDNDFVNALAVNGSKVFAGLMDDVYSSTDCGVTWVCSTPNINRIVRAITISSSGIYAGTNFGIYRSTNNGNNWNIITADSLTFITLYSVGTNVYASEFKQGLLYSSNSGTNWTGLSFISNDVPSAICYNENKLLVGTNHDGVIVSTNNGTDWTLSGLRNVSILTISGNSTFMLAGSYDYFTFRSTNNGFTWNSIRNDIPSGLDLCCYSDDTVSFMSIWGNELAYSTDNGLSWGEADFPQNRNALSFSKIGNRFFAGSDSGLFTSTDYGHNWSHYSLDSQQINSLKLVGNTLYAGLYRKGVWVSTNNGISFTPTALNNKSIYSIASIGNRIFAGTDMDGLYMSTNLGNSWNQIGFSGTTVQSVVTYDNYIFVGTRYGVSFSTNYGASWSSKNQGYTYVPQITQLFIRNNYIYSACSMQGVWYRSLSEIIGIKNISNEIPVTCKLSQNYPNPFNPVTHINFDIPENSFVKLTVFDVLGRKISTLVNENLKIGSYSVDWDASNYTSGTYFYKLESGNFSVTKKMLLIK